MAKATLTIAVDEDRLQSLRNYANANGKTPEELIEAWMAKIDTEERARRVANFDEAIRKVQYNGGGVIPSRDERNGYLP
ncbi:hypothetical protein BH11ARM2_BH11ARM2_16420 [soil metagenome]